MTMIREREEKRLGRPLKPPTPGKRVSLGLKVTAEVKQKIDEEARKTGRTQSQQAELLLERAFTEDAGFGGSEVRRLAIFMASAFAIAGQRSAAGKADWMDDPIAYSAGALGAAEALAEIAEASGGQPYEGDTEDIEAVYRSISSFF